MAQIGILLYDYNTSDAYTPNHMFHLFPLNWTLVSENHMIDIRQIIGFFVKDSPEIGSKSIKECKPFPPPFAYNMMQTVVREKT